VEQVLAMSLSKNGLDLGRLWERKRQAVEQTPGLTIWRGGETFDQIGGCDCIKRFLTAVLEGREAPRVIVFVDEIEKAFAGTGTDMSGVKTEMTGTMLSWMQDGGADGTIFIGPPGAAKSAVAKAAGATAGIPTVAFDLSAMQSSLVGGSGERLRAALQVVDAISQGRSLWIATCNSITNLQTELRRRFTLGTFFFDLPSAEERKAIWEIYLKKWNLSGELPDDEGWTGAEIKECCQSVAPETFRFGSQPSTSFRFRGRRRIRSRHCAVRLPVGSSAQPSRASSRQNRARWRLRLESGHSERPNRNRDVGWRLWRLERSRYGFSEDEFAIGHAAAHFRVAVIRPLRLSRPHSGNGVLQALSSPAEQIGKHSRYVDLSPPATGNSPPASGISRATTATRTAVLPETTSLP